VEGVLNGGDGAGKSGANHGLKVGILRMARSATSVISEASDTASKLSHVMRMEVKWEDAKERVVALPGVNATLSLPSLSEAKLRDLLTRMLADPPPTSAGGQESSWVAGGDMIASGPDVLLVEDAVDVVLEEGSKGMELFEKLVKEGECHALKDKQLC
jgi:hypothetical protein